MKHKVVIFNMPARNGKDLAAEFLLNKYGSDKINVLSFKDKLIEATARVLNIPVEDFLLGYDKPAVEVLGEGYTWCEWYKDFPLHQIGDKVYSKREALQHVSENVFKPLMGKDVFGNITASNLVEGKINIISDGGFDSEFKPLLEVADVLVLSRDRLSTGWGTDTRGWLTPRLGGVHIRCHDDIQDLGDFLIWVDNTITNYFKED